MPTLLELPGSATLRGAHLTSAKVKAPPTVFDVLVKAQTAALNLTAENWPGSWIKVSKLEPESNVLAAGSHEHRLSAHRLGHAMGQGGGERGRS